MVSFLGGVGGFIFSGGEAVNVTNGSTAAESAFQNNYLLHTDISALSLELKLCDGDPACELRVVKEYKEISDKNAAALDACGLDATCTASHLAIMKKAQGLAGEVLKLQLAGFTSQQILGGLNNTQVQDFNQGMHDLVEIHYLNEICPNQSAACLASEDALEFSLMKINSKYIFYFI